MADITIEGSSISSVESLHEEFSVKLNFPSYYGRNLDAMWDCLLDRIDEECIHLIWKDFLDSSNSIGEYCDKIIDMLNDLVKESDSFQYRLE